jgi:hypothetical protein
MLATSRYHLLDNGPPYPFFLHPFQAHWKLTHVMRQGEIAKDDYYRRIAIFADSLLVIDNLIVFTRLRFYY